MTEKQWATMKLPNHPKICNYLDGKFSVSVSSDPEPGVECSLGYFWVVILNHPEMGFVTLSQGHARKLAEAMDTGLHALEFAKCSEKMSYKLWKLQQDLENEYHKETQHELDN